MITGVIFGEDHDVSVKRRDDIHGFCSEPGPANSVIKIPGSDD